MSSQIAREKSTRVPRKAHPGFHFCTERTQWKMQSYLNARQSYLSWKEYDITTCISTIMFNGRSDRRQVVYRCLTTHRLARACLELGGAQNLLVSVLVIKLKNL